MLPFSPLPSAFSTQDGCDGSDTERFSLSLSLSRIAMYFSPFEVDWTGQVDDLSRAHTNGSASPRLLLLFVLFRFFLSAAAVLKAPLATGLLSKPARPDAIGSQRGL